MDTKNVIHYLANTSGQISNTALQLVEQQIFEMNKISKKKTLEESNGTYWECEAISEVNASLT